MSVKGSKIVDTVPSEATLIIHFVMQFSFFFFAFAFAVNAYPRRKSHMIVVKGQRFVKKKFRCVSVAQLCVITATSDARGGLPRC